MERVSVVEGDKPLLLVAPHGFDDDNTGEITKRIAEEINCYAVINNTWTKGDKVDWSKDIADCNNVYHCQEDVVKEEFFDPFIRYAMTIVQENQQCDIIIVHGMGNHVRTKTKDTIDGILGYGNNQNPSYSCDLWRKNGFLYLAQDYHLKLYEGAPSGTYSGFAKKNLNQYWRKWDYDDDVHSMQLELVYEMRKNDIVDDTVNVLSDIFSEYADFVNHYLETQEAPDDWDKNWSNLPVKSF